MKPLAVTITLVVALIYSGPISVDAQDNDSQKAAIALIKESRVLDSIDHVMRAAMEQVSASIKKKNPSITDETMDVIMDEAIKGLNNQKPIFLVEIAKLYTKYFTAEEMRTITEFYRTPTGKKSISVLPQLTVEGMEIGNQWAKAALPEVLSGIKKRLEEKGHSL